MKIKTTLSIILLICCSLGAQASSPYDKSVQMLLQDYADTKNLRAAQVAFMRCAALFSLTNLLVKDGEHEKALPNPDALMLGAGNIMMSLDDKTPEKVTKQLSNDFKMHTKSYQKWFVQAAKTHSNPLMDIQLKAELDLCNETSNAFESIRQINAICDPL